MATQTTIIAGEIGTAAQITTWQNDYNTARDNGYSFVLGCAVGTKLVAVLEKQAIALQAEPLGFWGRVGSFFSRVWSSVTYRGDPGERKRR